MCARGEGERVQAHVRVCEHACVHARQERLIYLCDARMRAHVRAMENEPGNDSLRVDLVVANQC